MCQDPQVHLRGLHDDRLSCDRILVVDSLALSSGEAEYYGVVRAAGIGLGQQALFRDAGREVPIRIWTDSSAAMGTSARQGLGKLRHLECHSLCLQQRLRRKQFELLKVHGAENPADLFTKHLGV